MHTRIVASVVQYTSTHSAFGCTLLPLIMEVYVSVPLEHRILRSFLLVVVRYLSLSPQAALPPCDTETL
jgi:hypothetical protein